MSIRHLYVSFGEVSVHVFCPFFDLIICFLGVEFEKFFIDLGYQPFICSVICKYLLPFRGLPLCFVDCFLCCAEVSYLDEVPKVRFIFCFSCLWRCVMKKVAVANVVEVAAYALLWDFDGFLSHIKVFQPFGVYLCVWCERVVKFHSFACSYPIFPAPFIEQTVFFLLDVFSCFV